MRPLNTKLKGAGKGGGGGSADEAPDTLLTTTFARLVDLQSEGELEGYADEDGRVLRDAYLSSQPTIIAGQLQNDAVIGYGGKGYPSAITIEVKDPSGSGSGAIFSATVVNGSITAITLVSGGEDYEEVELVIPPVIGRSIFFDDVPLQDANCKYNFKDVEIAHTLGTPDQEALQGFEYIEQAFAPSGGPTVVKKETPISVFVPESEASESDMAIISISVPRLLQIEKDGDTVGAVVRYSVYLTYFKDGDAQSEVLLYSETIRGKTTSGYLRQREYDLNVIRSKSAITHAYTFRVVRETNDSTSIKLENSIVFDSVTLLKNISLSYPNSAVVGLQVNAKHFSRIPTRAYRMKLMRISVPTNYFPKGSQRVDGSYRDIGEYNRNVETGEEVVDDDDEPILQTWDGDFYTAWTDNPAWIFYDICTNARYGLGDYIGEFGGVDKFELYKIARYSDGFNPDDYTNAVCDGLDDGFGDKEPRFACNAFIQSREEAYKVLQDFASVFRAMLYWGSGTIVPVCDMPKPIFEHFGNVNVRDGIFNYVASSRRVRHTAAHVRYNDRRDLFRTKYEYVEDYDGIIKYGLNEIEVAAFGCTSRGQARRFGRWLLLTARLETESITFDAGFNGAYLRPGQIISIADNDRSGVRHGGRIVSVVRGQSGGDIIHGDRPVKRYKWGTSDQAIANGDDADEGANGDPLAVVGTAFSVVLVSPQQMLMVTQATDLEESKKVEQPQVIRFPVKTLSLGNDGNIQIQLHTSASIPEEIVPGSVWGLESNQVYLQKARIMSVAEGDKPYYSVTCIEYDEDKFGAAEDNIPFFTEPISIPNGVEFPLPPTNFSATQSVIVSNDGRELTRVTIDWVPPNSNFIKGYNVYMKKGLGNFAFLGFTTGSYYELNIAIADEYFFQIHSVGFTGRESINSLEGDIAIGVIVDPETENTDIEQISGLELFDQGNSDQFNGADALFRWRINSPVNSYEIGSEPFANAGGLSPDFAAFDCVLYDPNVLDDPDTLLNEAVIYQTSVPLPSFDFTYELNRQLAFNRRGENNGIPFRDFIFEVRHRNQKGELSFPNRIRVSNPAPPKLIAGLSPDVDDTEPGKLKIRFVTSGLPDTAGWRVWVSASTGFNPASIQPLYEGREKNVVIELDADDYFIRYAEFDLFSQNAVDCNISDEVSITIDP